jgi:YD repeat-containing protein
MGDQPPTAGTTTTPPQEISVVETLLSLKDDKQRQALERYLTSQLVEQPRATMQRAETVIVDAAQSVPYFGPILKQAALKQSAEKIAQDLVAPVERAKAIQNAPVEGLAPATGADPIELATGQLAYTHTDLSLDGAGIRFEFIRTYRSQARYPNGPLGSCWDHNYNLWLREVDANTIAVGTGRLREDRYRRVSPGGPDPDYFTTDAGNDNTLIQNAKTQKYELHAPGGITHQFAPLGAFHAEDAGLHRLERTFDRFQPRNAITGEPEPPGNYLLFTYDANDTHLLRAIEVNHPTRQVLLDYDDLGRLISLADYAGRRVLYTYDDYDDLVAITLPPTQDRRYGRSTFYEYTSETGPIAHLLTSIVDADGRRYLEVEYGMGDGFVDRQRVIRQRDNEGEWLLQYADLDVTRDPNNPPDPDLPVRYTCVIQPNGHEVEYWFNDLGGVLFKADSYLDGEGVRLRALSRFQYNPDGKLIASLSPEGTFVQHYYVRDEYTLGSGLHVADPLSALPPLTAAQRMAFGNLRATVRRAQAPLPLLTWPDPAIANSILNTTANDIVQIFEFEPDAQLPLRVSDPRATADLVTPPARWLVEYEYSPAEYKVPVSITYPATQQPDGSVNPAAKELFTCDPNGRVINHMDAEGHTTHNEYYQDPDVAAGPDTPFGVEVILQPNPLSLAGYLKSTTAGQGEPNAATHFFQVNRRGIPVSTTDPCGAITRQVLDTTDQPVKVTRSLKPNVDYVTKYRYTGQAKVFRTESEIADDTGAPVLVDGTPLGSVVRQYRYTDIEQLQLLPQDERGDDGARTRDLCRDSTRSDRKLPKLRNADGYQKQFQ